MASLHTKIAIRHGLALAAYLVLAPAAFSADDLAYRCVDGNGRVMFSDMPCPVTTKRQTVVSTVPATRGAGGSEIRQLRNIQAIHASKSPDGDRGQGVQSRPVAAANNCPSERDIANLETKATSITLDKRSRDFLLAEVRRAKACSKEGGNYTGDDWDQVNRNIQDQNRIGARDREVARINAENTHAISASAQERARMQAEADRATALEAARIEAEARARRSPANISSCDQGGCWDTQGVRYSGSGSTLFGPRGACQVVGSQLHCP